MPPNPASTTTSHHDAVLDKAATAATKRKASSIELDDDASDKENVRTAVPAKKARAANKNPAAKASSLERDSNIPEPEDSGDEEKSAKNRVETGEHITTAKAKPASKRATTNAKPKTKAGNDIKAAKKQFDNLIKATEKKVKTLDKKVKAMKGNSISASDYWDVATNNHKVSKTMLKIDPALAFNLVVYFGDVAATYMDTSMKVSGYGENEDAFPFLDDALLPVIDAREKPKTKLDKFPEVPHRWSRADADVGEFKTGRPNKQQWNEIGNQRIEWEEDRRAKRRDRRVECEDWISLALADLKENRDYLDQYGVEGFFSKSIAKLEQLDAAR